MEWIVTIFLVCLVGSATYHWFAFGRYIPNFKCHVKRLINEAKDEEGNIE